MTPSLNSFPFPLITLPEVDSTNRYLTALCNTQMVAPAPFTTVLAHTQTAGKGQRGNSWESEPGRNITGSIVVYPLFIEARRQFVLSQIVSLTIKEELERYVQGISIKWPNDIYWGEKKICGILIENDLSGSHIARSIIGIGVNVNQELFRSDAPNPVSLKQITGQEHDTVQLLSGIISRLKQYYTLLQGEEATEVYADINIQYNCALFRKEGFHAYADGEGLFFARLLRVEPDGRLILTDKEGRQRSYLFKEVQCVLDNPVR